MFALSMQQLCEAEDNGLRILRGLGDETELVHGLEEAER